MRIVYVSYLHPDVAPGGEQQIAFELFEASLAQGHEAFLVSALEPEHDAIYGKPAAPIVPCPGRTRQYFFFPQFYDHLNLSVSDWRSLDFLKSLLQTLRPDVIHFHHYHRIGVEAFRIARLAAPQAIISLTLHEMMAICHANGQMVTRKTRKLCREATPVACNQCFEEIRPEFFILRANRIKAFMDEIDHFIFPSEFLAARYVAWGLPPAKCAVIPNGQKDLSAGFDRTGHSGALNRFGFFGQFLDTKGVDVIFEALIVLAREGRVPPQGIVVEINAANKHFATDAFTEKVNGLVAALVALKAPIQVIDREGYARHDLADRMRSIDWVIVPSTWWEIFGLVVSEAWMFGRPVLASRIGGLAERVVDNVNGFTFPPGDARGLADLMQAVCGDRETWRRLAGWQAPVWSTAEMLGAHREVWGYEAVSLPEFSEALPRNMRRIAHVRVPPSTRVDPCDNCG